MIEKGVGPIQFCDQCAGLLFRETFLALYWHNGINASPFDDVFPAHLPLPSILASRDLAAQ